MTTVLQKVDEELRKIGLELGEIVADHYSRKPHIRKLAIISCRITELVTLVVSAAQSGDISGGEARKRINGLLTANQTIKLYIEV